MDRIELLKTFISVAEVGSFSKAGELSHQNQSQISKMIRRLEDEYGVVLFNRTTRKISLTEAGNELLKHAYKITEFFEHSRDEVSSNTGEPKGKLKILTSDGTGRTVFLNVLSGFLAKYPQISIDHVMSDQFMPLADRQIDAAIWLGQLKDSNLKTVRIGTARRITVAAPSYLKQKGTPKSPEDLRRHNCIVFSRLANYTGLGQKVIWRYECPHSTRVFDIDVSGSYQADNSSIVKEAALKGFGIYQGPSYMFSEELKNGLLVELLPEYCFKPFPINILHNYQDYVPSRLRLFIDHFKYEFSLIPSVGMA